MTIEEFRNKLIEELIEKEGKDYEITAYDAVKNNGLLLHGINVKREGNNVSPTIYIDGYYKRFEEGLSIENIVEKILGEVEDASLIKDFDSSFFTDFDRVKKRLYVKLVNTAKNAELLQDIPSKEFLDLSMIVYCDVFEMCKMNGSILIKNEHLGNWNVGEEELIDIAYENTKHKKWEIRGFLNRIPEAIKIASVDVKLCDNVTMSDCITIPMYIMSNKELYLGAISMTFNDALNTFLKDGEGVYIIPSSIHEVILIPENAVNKDTSYINDMIKKVNEAALDVDEVLSDHAYYYSCSEGYLCV